MSSQTRHIFIIDTRVSDFETLIAALPPDSVWFLLASDQDGVVQIASALSGYSDLDSIHILSHGSYGTLYLGSSVLNNTSIAGYSRQLGQIGSSLTETGDILLYGCNVAAGDVGAQFMASLSAFTGADVVASSDLTGNAGLGGNWLLEEQLGEIEATQFMGISYRNLLLSETEPNNAFVTANSVAKGVPVIGTLSTSTDLDFYSVSVTSAGTLTVNFDVPTTSTSTNYFQLGLYNECGHLI